MTYEAWQGWVAIFAVAVGVLGEGEAVSAGAQAVDTAAWAEAYQDDSPFLQIICTVNSYIADCR